MPIVFELTQDPYLLHQYYQLREECYRKELGMPDFDGSEEEQDRQGKVLLGHRNGECFGGARICSQIPQKLIDELGYTPLSCCIWERFALSKEARKVQSFRDFCSGMIEASREAGYREALVLSSMRNARFYRQYYTARGLNFQIMGRLPEYAKGSFTNLEHYLSVAQIHQPEPIKIAA